MTVKNRWSPETYEWVMRLSGEGLTSSEIERETGVPRTTLRRWRIGRPPMFASYTDSRSGKGKRYKRCWRGHRLEGSNVVMNSTSGKRTCRTCKREQWRKSNYKRRHRYHPIYNPDLTLAPLHNLWLSAAEVVGFILDHRDMSDIWAELGFRSSDVKRIYLWRDGRYYWARYDVADRICASLGLALSMSGLEPVYGGQPPKIPAKEVNAA